MPAGSVHRIVRKSSFCLHRQRMKDLVDFRTITPVQCHCMLRPCGPSAASVSAATSRSDEPFRRTLTFSLTLREHGSTGDRRAR